MKKLYILLLCLAFPFAIHAQCPQRYLDKVFTKVDVDWDIIYGGHRQNLDSTRTWLALDLYQPKDDTAALRPLVVLIHGGGFTNWPPITRKSPDIEELANDLAKRGYVVVSPEYRLFSGSATYQKTIETAMAAAVDIQDAICFLVNSIGEGNPYRIDTSRFIIGGTSAGAALALNFGLFIDDSAMLSQTFRTILDQVAVFDNRDPQDILHHKFCGTVAKGVISISGALFDTTYIKYKNADVLMIHGTNDQAIPYGIGNVYMDPTLPEVFGPGVIYDIMVRAGMHVELDSYPGLWHVPILWNFSNDIPGAIQNTLTTGSIFNKPILDSTERHISRFCYTAIGSPVSSCDLEDVFNNIISNQLKISPNPSNGIFTVEIPKELKYHKINIQVQNMIGQTIYDKNYNNSDNISINISNQNKGMYIIKISFKENEMLNTYIDKIIFQ